PEVSAACNAVIVGDLTEIRRQADALALSWAYQLITENELGAPEFKGTTILDTGSTEGPVSWGEISAAGGRSAVGFIEAATRLCLEGKLDAIATAPINKESLKLAGSPFPGHTEMLTALCGASESLMCFFAGNLRVILLTIHVSLAEAIKAITKQRVLDALLLADRELRRFGLSRPRIAVAGLNPHASEHGLFGMEEAREIEPAVSECAARGLSVSGPFPADTLFLRASRGEFDAVVACYHDQGLIAVKCLAFGEAVNVTLGLPIIRTSVDHGTAFDIAGRGVADHRSMVEAIKLAARLAEIEVKSRNPAS
ncbi:MAG TPA: 4-hydroxythreonine-4-phosphate dehydrogenase PdxA, partial [Blastocatellia bacterium]|nr:4-hydroxythreonine-4-phosphate dehydrogenase PdxA [Blastocatellia bacterium]